MTFTTVGKNLIREWLAGQCGSAVAPSFIGLGSSAVAPTVADTTLSYEEVKRHYDSSDRGNDRLVEFEMICPSTVGVFEAREMGIFNGSPTGSMFVRNIFAMVNKTSDVELQTIAGVRIE
jgi:hypothetical protein